MQKLIEYTKSFGIAIIAALIIRALIIQSYKIPSGSMEDTLLVGDVLFVNKFIYGSIIPFTDVRLPEIRDPRSGDVVVFKYDGDSNNYIKRCIAAGGQVVEIRGKVVYVDGKEFEEILHLKFEDSNIYPKDYAESNIYPPDFGFNRDNYGPVRVPEDHFFMLGDNRDNSIDSRYRGIIPRRNIIGKALIIYWSWDSIKPIYEVFSKVRWPRIADIIR
ncbi:signal peptidase I [candidate division KSB1 bacterium]